MQVFKQFHKILLDIFNHMLPTIYTVKSLEPVLNCAEIDQVVKSIFLQKLTNTLVTRPRVPRPRG